ncbi:MAG: hypothetical protein H0X51_06725 [Parachlamydiaceae bacterium]|nr:hypothetical protein [Parachlamydiaceae bacterium]
MKAYIRFFLLIAFWPMCGYAAYTPSVYVNPTLWQELEPFFLPEDHPIKETLDALFLQSRITLSLKTLRQAGFKPVHKVTAANKVIVLKHSKLKRYLVKLFTDDQPFGAEWVEWKTRIMGAEYIQKAIERHNYQKWFKVPRKWIYPLTDAELPPGPYVRKFFVMVVEDMRIKSEESNYLCWRSIMLMPARLDALYTLLQEEGLMDSIYPDNVPFCKDGRQTFLDTMHYHKWPVNLGRLTPCFRSKMQKYWQQLIVQGGPKK